MSYLTTRARVWVLAFTLLLAVGFYFFREAGLSGQMKAKERTPAASDVVESTVGINKGLLVQQLGAAFQNNEFPNKFNLVYDGKQKMANIRYGLNEVSQVQMEKVIKQYHPDYAAFIAIDARTGRILSMVSFSEVEDQTANLTLRATFPAASIFKVVTASAVLDTNKAQPETVVSFNGANHTLYKHNVDDNRVNKWTRKMTMREAFARSINVIFSKLGLFYAGPETLMQYAERYFFNHQIPTDVPVQMGYAKFSADDPWSVATAASGFTRDNTMSPLQGALIASAVANDGVIMEPYLVDNIQAESSGETLYQVSPKQASIAFEPQSGEKLRELFDETVHSGTGRKSFRQTVRRASYGDVEFGGKTGSLTGLNPKGKCDWFVGYARYRDQRIAVAALTVNQKKWRVKSSMLANIFFTGYLHELKKNDQVALNSRHGN
jgi:cell division protein FtsI/penicillin-binding protein 2